MEFLDQIALLTRAHEVLGVVQPQGVDMMAALARRVNPEACEMRNIAVKCRVTIEVLEQFQFAMGRFRDWMKSWVSRNQQYKMLFSKGGELDHVKAIMANYTQIVASALRCEKIAVEAMDEFLQSHPKLAQATRAMFQQEASAQPSYTTGNDDSDDDFEETQESIGRKTAVIDALTTPFMEVAGPPMPDLSVYKGTRSNSIDSVMTLIQTPQQQTDSPRGSIAVGMAQRLMAQKHSLRNDPRRMSSIELPPQMKRMSVMFPQSGSRSDSPPPVGLSGSGGSSGTPPSGSLLMSVRSMPRLDVGRHDSIAPLSSPSPLAIPQLIPPSVGRTVLTSVETVRRTSTLLEGGLDDLQAEFKGRRRKRASRLAPLEHRLSITQQQMDANAELGLMPTQAQVEQEAQLEAVRRQSMAIARAQQRTDPKAELAVSADEMQPIFERLNVVVDHHLVCQLIVLSIMSLAQITRSSDEFIEAQQQMAALAARFLHISLAMFERALFFNLTLLQRNIFEKTLRGVKKSEFFLFRQVVYKIRLLDTLYSTLDLYVFPRTIENCHRGGVKSLCLSRINHSILLSAGYDRMAKTWNHDRQEQLAQYAAHRSVVTAALFSHDDVLLVTCSFDHAVRIWETGSAQLLHTLEDHEDAVVHIDISADNERLLSCSMDKTV
eukprot:TRINITY_DN1448_c0_g1_i2.p1 TRINITY_DN1448_c0_g1~~TRINITY_DN1448_c0_g1_i2.p1  ORF type:complete len:662 (+),score=123.86 TRINITY_DN1448_c0_g1_i2:46-2031(+)